MSNDLISREALKKAIEECKYCGFYGKLIEIINNAPTVEAFTKEDMSGAYNEGYACGGRENKRPQGEWIKITKNGTIPVEYICSVCGRKIFDNYELSVPQSVYYPFCHCGADMKGGAE